MISCIVTCYNLGEYLQDCLNSIFNLEGNFEVILIDDGSTDISTIKLLDKITNIYPDITLIRQNNLGLAAARNNAIKLSKGDFIIPFDADNKIWLK